MNRGPKPINPSSLMNATGTHAERLPQGGMVESKTVMTPPTDKLEAQTREEIDTKLVSAGWVVQDKKRVNLHQHLSVAVREFRPDTGSTDYMLFIAGKACGIIEAKREGTSLGHVAEQSARYATSNTKHIQRWAANDQPLPFLYETTNHEIRFRDERDSNPQSRNVFHFQRPQTLKDWLVQGDTFRARLQHLPEFNEKGLRNCQVDTIQGIEASLKQDYSRALLQMALGAGKTFPACTHVYRLAKFSKAKRELFLVERGKLAQRSSINLLDIEITQETIGAKPTKEPMLSTMFKIRL